MVIENSHVDAGCHHYSWYSRRVDIMAGVPSIIQNNRLVHAGNGQYGFKIGLLILLIVPLFALLPGNEYGEIHTDDETERTKVEEEMKRATLNRQVCIAIGCSIVLLGSMLAAILFC